MKQTFESVFLDIDPYCDGCPYLKAETEKTEVLNIEGDVASCRVRVICKNAGKCNAIYEYLKAKQKDSVAVVLKDMEEHFAYLCETGNLPECPEWEGEVFATIDKSLTKAGCKK